jgi:hypothetical protein
MKILFLQMEFFTVMVRLFFFDYKEDAKVFAKNLRKTKRFLLVRIKIKQKTEKSWKGKKFSPKFWYEIQAYGGK